ncbi:MAG: HAMP domain-containing histidine kinase [Lachnospiraceae bacterium]|nr:HAMP domain-containing histidine kinase [Lachnospiraceae bacterium]
MKKLGEHSFLRTVFLLLTAVVISFTLALSIQAIWLAGWGAYNAEQYFLNNAEILFGWSRDEVVGIWQNRYAILYGACFLLVFSICLMAVAVASAGHRKGKEGIWLRWQDRIPLDLYLAVLTGLEVFFICLIVWAQDFAWSPLSMIGLMTFCGIPAMFIGLHGILSVSIRVKAGKWWRNTLVYKILAGICRWIQKCLFGVNQTGSQAVGALADSIRTLPLAWKVLAALGVVFIANLYFALSVFNYYGSMKGPMLILWIVFDGVVVILLLRILKQALALKEGARRIADGDMDYQIDTSEMIADLKEHGETLNSINDGLSRAVEQRIKSERMKTELITNVSHDIKTPLTSIINYVDLLQKEELGGKAAEYLEVLMRQSGRLKRLIENLVEASKASTGNIPVDFQRLEVCEFIHQVAAEYTDRLKAGHLRLVVSVPEQELYVMADGKLLWRVFDNLLTNICKYALEGTRVYVDIHPAGGEVQIVFKNISRERLNIHADELLERFVQGDTSRNTEGSGLGLSIAQSLTQSQKGTLDLFVDGDLFKAVVCFKTVPGPAREKPETEKRPAAGA